MAEEHQMLDQLAHAFANANKLEKDGTNREKRFQYASAEQVKGVCRQALAEAGLALHEVRVEVLNQTTVQTSGGKERLLVVVKATVRIGDCHFSGIGAAADYGAEAYLKAQTTAVREAHKNMLALSTADVDAEDDRNGRRDGRTTSVGKATNGHAQPTEKQAAPAGDFVIPVGEHRGKRVSEMDSEWLAKVSTHPRATAELRQAAKQHLKDLVTAGTKASRTRKKAPETPDQAASA